MTVAGAAASPAAAALSARVAELLAMLDHSGVVRVVNVEPLPDGKTGYDLRILPEARALPASGPTRTPEAVQLVARVADLLIQGKAAGMVLREVTVDGAPIAAGRAEVTGLGTLLRAMLPKGTAQLPPVVETIIRRAVDAEAPDRYQSVTELRGDLLKLQQTLPVPSRGGTVELTRSAQLLAAMEFPDVVTVAGATTLPDGRIGYALRQLLDGGVPARLGLTSSGDVAALMARLSDALNQGRDAGMVLREVTSRGVTLPFAAGDARAELVALGTILRDVLTASQGAPTAPLAALIQRALDPEEAKPFDSVAELRDELRRQEQAARLIPMPLRPPVEVKSGGQWLWWFVAVAVVLTFLVVLLR
ncbi:MAG: hypothetical protein IPP98_14975 [Gemmatimonadetes bacterium]|nr:hypothetical protein [Gemmatimonadota bacterium]